MAEFNEIIMNKSEKFPEAYVHSEITDILSLKEEISTPMIQ